MNISVLRLAFDRLSGVSVCSRLVTPKRPTSLPTVLNRDEVWRLLSAADTARDQLLLGLMYGCGLKVGEVCALKWSDVDCQTGELRVGKLDRVRQVPFASQLTALLEKGLAICPPDEYVFRGNMTGAHLSTRMAEYVLRRAAEVARIDKPLCGMTLRHSYAVHRLQDGATIRDVQGALGLNNIHSVMMYLRCLPPAVTRSPLDMLVKYPKSSEPIPALPDNQEPITNNHLPVPSPELPAELPFRPATMSIAEQARLFYRSLKLHVRARYLAVRHAIDGT
jgi:integrase